ncbi:MAG: NUDIX domain-containing protein [Kineosporiaceae bacterium]
MAARVDFHDDPDAPTPTTVVPSANAVVTDGAGRVLVIRRADNGTWALPGGAMDLGESLVATAVREVREETGIDCEVTGLVGIYTDPGHVIRYLSNGEVRQEFSIVYTARAVGGTPTTSSESLEVVWVARDRLADLAMERSMRLRVEHYLADRGLPYLG